MPSMLLVKSVTEPSRLASQLTASPHAHPRLLPSFSSLCLDSIDMARRFLTARKSDLIRKRQEEEARLAALGEDGGEKVRLSSSRSLLGCSGKGSLLLAGLAQPGAPEPQPGHQAQPGASPHLSLQLALDTADLSSSCRTRTRPWCALSLSPCPLRH